MSIGWRNPNPQIGFGAGGAHFCLGANLARREIAVAFDELCNRVPDIEVAAEPEMLHSPFVHGIKRLPVEWTPPAQPAERANALSTMPEYILDA